MKNLNQLLEISSSLLLIQNSYLSSRFQEKSSNPAIQTKLIENLNLVNQNFKSLKASIFSEGEAINPENRNTLMLVALNLALVQPNEVMPPSLENNESFINSIFNEDGIEFDVRFRTVYLYSELLDVLVLCDVPSDNRLNEKILEINDILSFHTKELLKIIGIKDNANAFIFLYKRVQSSYINIFKSIVYGQLNTQGSVSGGSTHKLEMKNSIDRLATESEEEVPEIENEDINLSDFLMDEALTDYDDETSVENNTQSTDKARNDEPSIGKENAASVEIFYQALNESLDLMDETKPYIEMMNNSGGRNEERPQF